MIEFLWIPALLGLVWWIRVLRSQIQDLQRLQQLTHNEICILSDDLVDIAHNIANIVVAPPTSTVARECVIKTLRFADGHVAQKHTICGDLNPELMTDDWAKELHPGADLVSITTSSHLVGL